MLLLLRLVLFILLQTALFAGGSAIPELGPQYGNSIRSVSVPDTTDAAVNISSSISSALLLYTAKDGDRFLAATQRWSEFSSPSAAAVVVARSVEDVVATVRAFFSSTLTLYFLCKSDILFLARDSIG